MARLIGVDLPRDKRLEVALTYIYGVGRTRAQQTLAATGISPDARVKDLGDAELVALRDYLEGNYKLEGDLRREVAADIRRKVEIGTYQGLRHRRDRPVAHRVRPAPPRGGGEAAPRAHRHARGADRVGGRLRGPCGLPAPVPQDHRPRPGRVPAPLPGARLRAASRPLTAPPPGC